MDLCSNIYVASCPADGVFPVKVEAGSRGSSCFAFSIEFQLLVFLTIGVNCFQDLGYSTLPILDSIVPFAYPYSYSYIFICIPGRF